MEKEYNVYKITNKLNGKVYIGLSKNLKARWSSNGIHYKECKYFYNAIQKYGWNNFKKEIIQDNLTREEAGFLEIDQIKFFKSHIREFGYNIALGGFGGVVYKKHPRGMLGKSQTKYQIESHRKWASNKDNNCMTNGQVIWGETHKHPQGMKDKQQSEKQKNSARGNKYKCLKIKATFPNKEVIVFDSLNECCSYFNIQPASSVIRRLLKTNEPYKLSSNITKEVKEKLVKMVGLTLEYIPKDNSEV